MELFESNFTSVAGEHLPAFTNAFWIVLITVRNRNRNGSAKQMIAICNSVLL
jgi:hypothetical protein